MGLPFSKLRRGSTDETCSFSKTSWSSVLSMLLSPASSRRQEIYRVRDRHGLYACLRAEIDCLDAVHNLSDEVRRIHVSRLQLAHRHRAVRLNGQAQHHLALQCRIDAQCPVVVPVESRFITIEDDLNFFISAGSPWAAVGLGSAVAAADPRDGTFRAGHLQTGPAHAAATTASAATTTNIAAQRAGIDATT